MVVSLTRYRKGFFGVSRYYAVQQRLRPAMLALRDAEDWARLELGDELLASRVREIHESLTDDVLRGSGTRHSARYRSRLWDRYVSWRGHDPHEHAAARSLGIRQAQRSPNSCKTTGVST